MSAEEVLLDFKEESMMSGSEDDFSDLGENTEDLGSDDEDPSPPLSPSHQPRVPPTSLQPRVLLPSSLQPRVPSPSLQPRVLSPSLQPRVPIPPPSPTWTETVTPIQVCVHMHNQCIYVHTIRLHPISMYNYVHNYRSHPSPHLSGQWYLCLPLHWVSFSSFSRTIC